MARQPFSVRGQLIIIVRYGIFKWQICFKLFPDRRSLVTITEAENLIHNNCVDAYRFGLFVKIFRSMAEPKVNTEQQKTKKKTKSNKTENKFEKYAVRLLMINSMIHY